MATRRSVLPRRHALLAVGLATVAAAGVLPGAPAAADRRPTIAEVQHRVEALNQQADVAVEEYEQARIALATARRRSAVSQARVHRANAELAAVQRAMASVASSAYRTGGAGAMVSLVQTSSPQTFLDRAASLDLIARSQAERLAAVATARHRLQTVQADAARDLGEQKTVQAKVARHRAVIEQTLRTQQTLLEGLRAEERARLARLQAQRIAAAQRAAAAARASRARSLAVRRAGAAGQSDSSGGGSTYAGPASGRAGAAVSEAYAKLGSPYEWAAAGPDRFDCSGLTMWAWARGGVSLPHSSQAQYDVTRRVAQSEVQPGDLVFFGNPIHHVGIYIGGGSMISAPHTGDVVKIQDAFRGDYVGAGRP